MSNATTSPAVTPDAQQYRVGELVDVTIKGARIMAPKPGVDDVLTLAYEEVEPGVFATIELRHPSADSVTVERTAPADKRAAMVAAIRALADFVESRTDLPVPTSIYAQATLSSADPAHEDTVRDAAAKLGVEPSIHSTAISAQIYLSEYPQLVGYTVHGLLHERVR